MEDKKIIDTDPVNKALTLLTLLNVNKNEVNNMDVLQFQNDIKKHIELIQNGDLSNLEAILSTQVFSLNLLFNKMAAKIELAEEFGDAQIFVDLAMKIQNNCRKTVLTLSEIRNPKKTTFIKQQNCAVNQQVNNDNTVDIPKKSSLENELLKVKHVPMELRTTITAIPTDSQLETMGEINRGENSGRKGYKQDECL